MQEKRIRLIYNIMYCYIKAYFNNSGFLLLSNPGLPTTIQNKG